MDPFPSEPFTFTVFSPHILFFWFFSFTFVVQLYLSPFSPITLPCPTQPPSPTFNPSCLLSLSMGPLHMFLDLTLPLLSPVIPLSPPLCSLPVCSLFPCLWFYFGSLFVLLIRFHLQVRSYGIFHHMAYFAQHNALQFHPCCPEGYELLSFCCVVFHCVNVSVF